MTKDKSSFVEVLKVVIPALSAIVVAYFGYRQVIEPKTLEIAATQTSLSVLAVTQVALVQAPVATAPVTREVEAAATMAVTATNNPAPTPQDGAAPTLEESTVTPVASLTPVATAAMSAPTAPSTPAATSAPAAPSGNVEDSSLVVISSEEGGVSESMSVLPETLRFQEDTGFYLRSGEFIPFTNLGRVEVGPLKSDIIPLVITFSDGITLTGTLLRGSDLLEGETTHSSFQKHMESVKTMEFPGAGQAPGAPSVPAAHSLITLTVQEGDTAQVISNTLRFQGDPGLYLRSGEFIPFENLLSVETGNTRSGAVPLSITFSDGVTLTGSVEKDSDLLQGETVHGSYQKNMFALKRLELPNAGLSLNESSSNSEPLVTITNPEGERAQVIASTLRIHGDPILYGRSGESFPLADLAAIEVGELDNGVVPLEITFADGDTLSASVEKDADLVQGETLHGSYLKPLYSVKRLDFPSGQ